MKKMIFENLIDSNTGGPLEVDVTGCSDKVLAELEKIKESGANEGSRIKELLKKPRH